MIKLIAFALMVAYVGECVSGDPLKCFVCTSGLGPDETCGKNQTPGGEVNCQQNETKCVTKLEKDVVVRACAADSVVDSDTVMTCAAPACNSYAWSEGSGDHNATDERAKPAGRSKLTELKSFSTLNIPTLLTVALPLLVAKK